MSGAVRGRFQRQALHGLARLDKMSLKNISESEKNQDMSSTFRFGLAREFFQGFANEARCNLHLELLVRRRTASCGGGLVQGVRPGG